MPKREPGNQHKTARPTVEQTTDSLRKQRGKEGENAAARFFEHQGFTVLERNFRAGHNEIDLIVRKNNLIVFVEVKTSVNSAFGHPAERVDLRKQQRIVKVARQYLIGNQISDIDLRLDVVTFVGDTLEHYPNAFSVDEDER